MRRRSSLACLFSTSTTPTRCACSRTGGSAIGAPVPMHPSFEDREGAPDVLLAAVPAELVEHLSSVWEGPFRCRWSKPCRCLSSSSLDAAARRGAAVLARGAVVAHLHGTELKFLEAVERTRRSGQVGGDDAGRHARVGTDQPGRDPPARRSRSESCCGPRVGSNGCTARPGAIGCAARLTPPTIWSSCRPLTGHGRRAAASRCRAGLGRSQRRGRAPRSVHDR